MSTRAAPEWPSRCSSPRPAPPARPSSRGSSGRGIRRPHTGAACISLGKLSASARRDLSVGAALGIKKPNMGEALPRPQSRGPVDDDGPDSSAPSPEELRRLGADSPGLAFQRMRGAPMLADRGTPSPALFRLREDEEAFFDDEVRRVHIDTIPMFEAYDKDAAAKGTDHITELLSWVKPRSKDGGFFSPLNRLSVEIGHHAQEWSAYRYGSCRPHEGKAALKVPPPDPPRTALATSLLLRLVRCFPSQTPLRSMLEPVVQEVLESVYTGWTLPSLDDLTEAEISPQRVEQHATYFAVTGGHKANAEREKERAERALEEFDQLMHKSLPMEKENLQLHSQVQKMREELAIEKECAKKAQAELADLTDTHEKFREQTKITLKDFDEVQHSVHILTEDIRADKRDLRDKEAEIQKLVHQVTELTHSKHELQDMNTDLRCQIASQESDIEKLHSVQERLDRLQKDETLHGVSFARRVCQEVLGMDMTDVCGRELTRRSSAQNTAQGHSAKEQVLDVVCSRLKALRAEIEDLKVQMKRLRWELKDSRSLIPVWNLDFAVDLADAYDQDAPIHRQTYSMKDKRNFAGLGSGQNVPPYLRAEGFVRHVFVSKGEMEDFINGFMEYLRSEERAASTDGVLTTEQMHQELHWYLKRKFGESESLTEFAYAFICGLETFRDDPDFELFDLMLCGVVHPSIVQDQQHMLHFLETLVRACQEGSSELDRNQGRSGTSSSTAQVSKRVLRAVLQAVFPDKPQQRHNALQRALHLTVQAFVETSGAANQDCVFINDLFSQNADGSQTIFIEEVRRQHCYEVIEFALGVTRAVMEKAKDTNRLEGKTNAQLRIHDRNLRQVLSNCDPHMQPQVLEQLVGLGCPEPNVRVPIGEALRRLRNGALLKCDRLWIRAAPKDVMHNLLSSGPAAYEQSEAGSATPSTPLEGRSRRYRAVKVIENPLAKVPDDIAATEASLQRALSKSAQRNAEMAVVATAASGAASVDHTG